MPAELLDLIPFALVAVLLIGLLVAVLGMRRRPSGWTGGRRLTLPAAWHMPWRDADPGSGVTEAGPSRHVEPVASGIPHAHLDGAPPPPARIRLWRDSAAVLFVACLAVILLVSFLPSRPTDADVLAATDAPRPSGSESDGPQSAGDSASGSPAPSGGLPFPSFLVSPTANESASPATTPAPTVRPAATPTRRPTPIPTPEPSPTPTAAASPTPSPTPTPAPSPTPTPTPKPTPTPAPSPTPTPTPTPEPTPKPTPRRTPPVPRPSTSPGPPPPP